MTENTNKKFDQEKQDKEDRYYSRFQMYTLVGIFLIAGVLCSANSCEAADVPSTKTPDPMDKHYQPAEIKPAPAIN